MEPRIFFAPPKHAPMSGESFFLAITEGETGYNASDVFEQAHADVLNERLGNSPAEVEAAVVCSMFNTWNKFDEMVEKFEEKTAC